MRDSARSRRQNVLFALSGSQLLGRVSYASTHNSSTLSQSKLLHVQFHITNNQRYV